MKTIFFIAATVAFNALSVFADGTISVKQTVLQRYFDNDPAKYQKAIRKLFAKFDANEDREINAVDFEHLSSQSNMILKQLMGSSSMGTQSVKDMVMSFDKDGNGNVSQKEFETGMAPYQKQVVTVKMSMCDAAKQIIDKCKPVVTIGTMKIKLQSSMCKMGLTAFGGYPIESCIQKSAGNCDAINKCFSNAFGGTSRSPAMRKRSLVRRDAQQNSLRVWFWVSMIVLAIPAFASIIGIPFYFIAVYVASKYMALPMNDTIGQ